MKKRRISAITLAILLAAIGSTYAAESLNVILATVGSVSISEIDYEYGYEAYTRLEKHLTGTNRRKPLRTRVLDFLIDRAIVDVVSEMESIQIDDRRVKAEVQRRMDASGASSKNEFRRKIEQQTGMNYKLWLSELPFQLKKSQLMQIRVNVPPPSEKEVRQWYYSNQNKVGFEIRYREIAIEPRNASVQEETRVYKELAEIRKEAVSNPSSFSLIASGPRNDSSLRANGGLVEWIPTFELFNYSKIIAGVAARMSPGSVSNIFRDERKRYVIIKLEGKRATPLDRIRNGIQNVLYQEKEEQAFDDWLAEERENMHILIFDEQYRSQNNMPPLVHDSFDRSIHKILQIQ